MASWSEPFLVYESPFMTDGGGKASPESPYLLKRGGIYYLFWCIYDGFAGCYDHRTFVFAAETIDGFRGKAPITMLDAHAPEIVTDDDGRTFLLSVFYPENGVSAAELVWETGDGQ